MHTVSYLLQFAHVNLFFLFTCLELSVYWARSRYSSPAPKLQSAAVVDFQHSTPHARGTVAFICITATPVSTTYMIILPETVALSNREDANY